MWDGIGIPAHSSVCAPHHFQPLRMALGWESRLYSWLLLLQDIWDNCPFPAPLAPLSFFRALPGGWMVPGARWDALDATRGDSCVPRGRGWHHPGVAVSMALSPASSRSAARRSHSSCSRARCSSRTFLLLCRALLISSRCSSIRKSAREGQEFQMWHRDRECPVSCPHPGTSVQSEGSPLLLLLLLLAAAGASSRLFLSCVFMDGLEIQLQEVGQGCQHQIPVGKVEEKPNFL